MRHPCIRLVHFPTPSPLLFLQPADASIQYKCVPAAEMLSRKPKHSQIRWPFPKPQTRVPRNYPTTKELSWEYAEHHLRHFQQICEVVPRATNTRESCGPTPRISGPIPLFRVSPDLTRLLQYASGGALLNCFGDLCYASRFAVKDLSTDAALCWSLLFPECICV